VTATLSSVSASTCATRSTEKPVAAVGAAVVTRAPGCSVGAKWSNGSRQPRHRHIALHDVEPKRVSSSVSAEPHCGHATCSTGRRPSGTSTGPSARDAGGAIPYASSLRRPSSVIQSVVQAGDSTVRSSTSSHPCRARAARTSASISCMAGQPL
jgi:hypothetical protein